MIVLKDFLKNMLCFRFVNKSDCGPSKRKTLKGGEYSQMEAKLYSWFCAQRLKGLPISYEILAAKAQQFYFDIYGNNDFQASRGWISNFRKRHGLRSLKVCGEKLSNNESAVQPFISLLGEKMKQLNLTQAQVYNADESALYWKMLPDKTLVRAQEKSAPGRKISKERITFLICCNADGSHKLKPLVIGKSRNPRAFKNVNLPVEYKFSSSAWMTTAIFRQWFHHTFVDQVRAHLKKLNLPETALLIVDNAPSHGAVEELVSEDGKFLTLFLPPNCTALLQPMDPNAIRLTKLYYRKSLIAHILAKDEDDLSKTLKSISLRNAVVFLSNAWGKVSSEVLQKCWKKLIPSVEEDSEYDSDDCISLKELASKMNEEIGDLMNMVNEITEQNLSSSELKNWLENDEELLPLEDVADVGAETEESETNETVEIIKTVKNSKAVECFNSCIRWAEENNCPINDILVLERLREEAILKTKNVAKQTKISHYFKK